MKSRIGSNLVLMDLPDDEPCYVEQNYIRLLEQYARYADLIGWLEFSHVVNVTPDQAVRIGNAARKHGLEPWSIHSEHLNVGDTVENYLKIQKHEAEVCAALGCQVMVCHLPNLTPYVDFERDLDVIGKVAELSHANGIRLAVETCYYPDPSGSGEILPDAALVIKVVETLDLSDVGINLDSGHCFFSQTRMKEEYLEKILSGEIEQWIPSLVKRIGKKLFTTHLQDNFGLNDDHQAPGFGYIDWEKLVPAILETGYQGPLMMELTGMGVKSRRTVPQMRKFPLEKEIIAGSSLLQFYASSYSKNH